MRRPGCRDEWWFADYPGAGYGESFHEWAESGRSEPYDSWGNGSAMRVSAVGWLFPSLLGVREAATASAMVTHNHPEGVKAACAVAEAVFLARTGASKLEIQEHIAREHAYNLTRPLHTFRRRYVFHVAAALSVPEAIRCFQESTSWEDAVRNAISLGGDADTQAAIAGSIAEASYGGVPPEITAEVLPRLDDRIRALLGRFSEACQTR